MVDGAMARIIETIESAPGGVLYFCSAGKDRTGVVSALLLLRAGASRQEIVDDYTATYENLKDGIEEWCRFDPAAEVFLPKAIYMEQFLDSVKF
jgi:protein tyrosine/serine phosphatase